MNTLLTILLFSWLAGLASLLGGLLACGMHSHSKIINKEATHGIIAFGGGILVSAVALALIPMGMKQLSAWQLCAMFCAGGGVFCALDIWMARHGGSKAQFIAMLTDFLPEAISMGAVFATDAKLGVLLAVFIGMQNLPEGYNAYREIVETGSGRRKPLYMLGAASLLGPLAAGSGYLFLRDLPLPTALIVTFASGGILYIIFQDIAPKAKLKRHWIPAMGAVLGFAAGMAGKALIG